MNYIYLIGNECKDRCEGYYKYSTNDGFIHCFLTPDECYNYGTTPPVSIYYEEETKKCWKTFPEGDYYIKSFDPAISPPKYELVRQCEYYYYKGDTPINGDKRNFCVDKCESSTATNPQQKFYVSGNKKCLEKCDDADKYYYYYYECLDTCEIKADKPFSLPRSTFPQECKAWFCPSRF